MFLLLLVAVGLVIYLSGFFLGRHLERDKWIYHVHFLDDIGVAKRWDGKEIKNL